MITFFKRATVILICIIVFGGSAYLYLYNDETQQQSNASQSAVPYSTVPENAYILFYFPASTLLFDLNFEENALFITIDPPKKELPNEYFSVTGDNSLIAGMIDRIGGIELMWNSELLRFTGYQLTDMLEQSKEQQNLSLRILEEYIKKLGEIGITRQDLVYLIENSNTDLRVPDCFYWHNYIDKLCKNYKINY